MKLEPTRFREKTTEFFGKKGISWHGAVLIYCGLDSSITGVTGTGDSWDIQTLFFDHIVCNNMTQDMYAVCCLLHAALARVKLEVSSIESVHILSDNASCYQNDLLPAMVPFIAKEHNLSIAGIVHSETQRGKSLVNAHFALAMMHINRYCNETQRDVTTPADIVIALNHNGGVANCSAELVYTDRTSEFMQPWIDAHKNKDITKLGRLNEIEYDSMCNGIVEGNCYELSGRIGKRYRFGKFYLLPIVSQAIGQADEIAPLAEEAEVYPTEGEAGVEVIEIENAAEGIQTGHNPDESQISRPHKYAYRSKVTGAILYSRAPVRRQLRRRKGTTRPQHVMEDTIEDLMTPESTNNDPGGSHTMSHALLQCAKCQLPYRRPQALAAHEKDCEGVFVRTAVDRAARMALRIIGSSDAPIYTTKRLHPVLLNIPTDAATKTKFLFAAGWGKRPKHGQSYVPNSVNLFSTDIIYYFGAGEQDKGKKMNVARMRQDLEKKYPTRYDLPREHQITAFVSGLLRKKKRILQQGGNDVVRMPSPRIAANIVETLQNFIDLDSNIKPKQAWLKLLLAEGISDGNMPDGFPLEKTIKSKVTRMKKNVS